MFNETKEEIMIECIVCSMRMMKETVQEQPSSKYTAMLARENRRRKHLL